MLRRPSAAVFAFAVAGLLSGSLRAVAEEKSVPEAPPRIQLAILLDTSGSMQGLINQARTQIWKIVDELATAKRDGKAPELEVALYHYGNSGLTKQSGYVKQLVPLTTDLDLVSEELFALATNGGEEYCGRVVKAAVEELKWSNSDRDLKLVFVAGNEAFTQGDLDPKVALQSAIDRGIVVNTIFCGNQSEGANTGWNLSEKFDGSFTFIDQNQKVAEVKTPFDVKLVELGTEINKTFIVYGSEREREDARGRQLSADKAAAASAPGVGANRAAFKAKAQYRVQQDLVDALERKLVKLEDLEDADLPEDLRKLDQAGRKKYVAEKTAERAEIQKQINELSAKRKKFIAEARKRAAEAEPENTLDTAVLDSIRKQAETKKFEFADEN